MIGQSRFVVAHNSRQIESRKGEDMMVLPVDKVMRQQRDKVIVFAICDGHAGQAAASFVAKNIEAKIKQQFKLNRVNQHKAHGLTKFAQLIKKSVKQSFLELEKEFSKRFIDAVSGTTLTVAVIYGNLLTVGNVGDSKAILLTADGHYTEMSVDHRIEVNMSEQMRLTNSGACIERIKLFGDINGEGVGPLRLWPAGLAVSRSIGDKDGRPFVAPHPQVKTVIVPEGGARLIIASDGLWDVFSAQQVAAKAHKLSLEELPGLLIRHVQKVCRGFVKDDTSIIVADLFPRGQNELYDNENTSKVGGVCCWAQPTVQDAQVCLSVVADEDTIYDDDKMGRNSMSVDPSSMAFIQDMQGLEDISDLSSKNDVCTNKLSAEVKGLRRCLSAEWANQLYSTQVSGVDRVGSTSRKYLETDI